MNDRHYPNESAEYRKARDELLQAELDLRERVERVAAQRRTLPPGGELKEDYVFDELVDGEPRKVRFSELFSPARDTLFLYGFMYAPDMPAACPSCTSMLDGLDGQVRHLRQRIDVAVVAKHDLEHLHEHARSRGWADLRLLSSAGNSYNVDYHTEREGAQMPCANVFRRADGVIRHFWGTEMLYGPAREGQNARHVDLIWPLWNVLDMTPGGRGTTWYPRLSYDG
jgi:predicted dithiol-disulfide oxidoreductase (DUF899 family)